MTMTDAFGAAGANPGTAAIPASPASQGTPSVSQGAMTPSAFDRLGLAGSQEYSRNHQQLALTPYEYGLDPGGINQGPYTPTFQDQHPSAQRMASGQWAGKTNQLNHAQAAQDNADVWVTVPVDKVTTRGGVSTVNAMYATPRGYVPRPGSSGGSIPPPQASAAGQYPSSHGQGMDWTH